MAFVALFFILVFVYSVWKNVERIKKNRKEKKRNVFYDEQMAYQKEAEQILTAERMHNQKYPDVPFVISVKNNPVLNEIKRREKEIEDSFNQ
jgi:flagellar basal body-associated protein FliL